MDGSLTTGQPRDDERFQPAQPLVHIPCQLNPKQPPAPCFEHLGIALSLRRLHHPE